MYHTSKHSGIGQVNSSDADAILRLYTDSIAAYVENTQRSSARDHAGGWEAARIQRAERLGVEYVAHSVSIVTNSDQISGHSDTDCLRTDGECLRLDIELGRMAALGLKQAPFCQRWTVLHDMARQTGKQGFTFAELEATLRRYHVKGCTSYNRRIVRAGIGLYWQYDLCTDKLYPTGYVELTRRIIDIAHSLRLYDLYATNAVGDKREMYVRVGGAAADFESAVLEAWYASKNNPTISREVLRLLTNRDDRSLRYLEKRAGIVVVKNEVETLDPVNIPLRANGELRTDVYRTIDNFGRTVWHYRLPNTYKAGIVKQHHVRGQTRRAAYTFSNSIPFDELHATCGEGEQSPVKLKAVGRIYCETETAMQQNRERGNANALHMPFKPGRGGGIVWRVYITTMYQTH